MSELVIEIETLVERAFNRGMRRGADAVRMYIVAGYTVEGALSKVEDMTNE